jgi:hypothetical protein
MGLVQLHVQVPRLDNSPRYRDGHLRKGNTNHRLLCSPIGQVATDQTRECTHNSFGENPDLKVFSCYFNTFVCPHLAGLGCSVYGNCRPIADGRWSLARGP